jgi:redox-sensing transcriptional repressor
MRLSHYKNALNRFNHLGFQKIFSDYLAETVGVTSAQVRKDFSIFGISGNKRGGYKIDSLLHEINEILGKNEVQKVILCGAGHLGSALMKYRNFEKESIKVVAAFDIDPSKQTLRGPVPVFPMEQMEEYIRSNNIKFAILCVPDIAAQQVLDSMVKCGIRGVLNFAPMQLKICKDCRVNDVNLAVELENLVYFVNSKEPSPAGVDE